MMNDIANQKKKAIRNSLAEPSGLDQGKLPPQALDLEQAVLGALMIDPMAVNHVIDALRPEYFYKQEHQLIYGAISRLFNASQPVDIMTVANDLKQHGELELAGGAYYVATLTNKVASAAHIEAHAKIVQQKYVQRELIRIGSDITRTAFDDTADPLQLLDDAESKLLAVGENSFRSDYTDINLLIKEYINEVEDVSKRSDQVSGVPSGFAALDRITSGWQKGTLLILAARPGMGKTAFALTMARNIAVDFKKPVAIFSLEMSAMELVGRLLSAETRIPGRKFKQGDLAPYEWEWLNSKAGNLASGGKICIDDTSALTMFELRAKCRRLKQQHDIQMVFIDYLQLMRGDGSIKGNREQEISQISRQLKGLAKELKIPILALSQLSRAVETRSGEKKPQLSDLRESGAIEQDADMVMFIYRPEYYGIHGENAPEGAAELLIEKHRSGSTGSVPLRFIKEFAKFEDAPSDFGLPGGGHSASNDQDFGSGNVGTFDPGNPQGGGYGGYSGGYGQMAPNTSFDTPAGPRQSVVTYQSSINKDIPVSNGEADFCSTKIIKSNIWNNE